MDHRAFIHRAHRLVNHAASNGFDLPVGCVRVGLLSAVSSYTNRLGGRCNNEPRMHAPTTNLAAIATTAAASISTSAATNAAPTIPFAARPLTSATMTALAVYGTGALSC